MKSFALFGVLALTHISAMAAETVIQVTPEAYIAKVEQVNLKNFEDRQRLLDAIEAVSRKVCADVQLVEVSQLSCVRRTSREITRDLPQAVQPALKQARAERKSS